MYLVRCSGSWIHFIARQRNGPKGEALQGKPALLCNDSFYFDLQADVNIACFKTKAS